MDTKIVLPEGLIKVCNGDATMENIEQDVPLMVFYNSPSTCTSCALNHLNEWSDSVLALEAEGKCRVIVVFSPLPEFLAEMTESIREMNFSFPVYVDPVRNFERLNVNFPEDLRFHCFLLGMDGYPAFVGNPFLTKELRKVFDAALKNL